MEISTNIKLLLGIISSLIAVICFVPYIMDILKNKTQPHMYSWLVWTVLQIVGSIAHFQHGGGYGSWALLVGTFFCFIIFILSFKYGTKNINRFDFLCLVLSFSTIFIYFGIDNPVWAVIVIVLVDTIAFLPTMRKAYEEPQTETESTFALSASSNFISLFALQNYNFTTVFYSVALLVTNSTMVAIVYFRKKYFR